MKDFSRSRLELVPGRWGGLDGSWSRGSRSVPRRIRKSSKKNPDQPREHVALSATEIGVDAFATRVCDWSIAMVVRTGPEEFNVGAMPGQETGNDGPLFRWSHQGGLGAEVSNRGQGI